MASEWTAMPTLQIELDAETVEALDVERSLLGFESRSAYVRWIVDHRDAIDAERSGDGDRSLLNRYRARIADLEAALGERERAADPSGDDDERTTDVARPAHGSASADGDAIRRANTDGGWTPAPSAVDPDSGGSRPVEQSVSPGPARSAPVAPGRDGDGGSETDRSETARTEEIDAVNLEPERVERVRDDPVAEDAGVLGTVAVDRLDELSRRAVARTRERLNRDVETGLEYASNTALADDATDVRPGADVVDLDSLPVRGRTPEVRERRRAVAGRVIAVCRDEGAVRKADAVEAFYEEHPAGYDTADAWWECIKEALSAADCIDGGDGSRTWRFTE